MSVLFALRLKLLHCSIPLGPTSGEFSGGGRIAVECSPLLVAEIDTKGSFGKVDGRFPHWVTPYEGERFSLIYVSELSCRNCSAWNVL